MAGHQPPPSGPDRLRQITTGLWLVWVSVAFGIVSGAVSVTTGLADHSLSVLAVGLGVLADVTGSAILIWLFRTERRQPGRSEAAEVLPRSW
jgi:divalent metal cation (Fe/Co/Zn/Cd) transporter